LCLNCKVHKVMSKAYKVHMNTVGYVCERKQQVNKSNVYIRSVY